MDMLKNPPRNFEWPLFLIQTSVSVLLLTVSLLNITMGWGKDMNWNMLLAGCLGYFIPNHPITKRIENIYYGSKDASISPQQTAKTPETVSTTTADTNLSRSVDTTTVVQSTTFQPRTVAPGTDVTGINTDVAVGGTQLAKAV